MNWESRGAAFYYLLGAAYYVYHWFLILGAGGLVGSILLRQYPFMPVIALVSSGTIVAGVIAWLGRTKKRLDSLNPDVSILSQTDTYTVGDTSCSYVKNVTILAMRRGLESYKIRFRWTGRGTIKCTISPSNEYRAVVHKASDDTWDLIDIHPIRPLRKNEDRSLEIKLEMEDLVEKPLPFLQKLIDDFYPNEITMRVVLQAPPSSVIKEIFFSPRAIVNAAYERVDSPTTKTIEWTIQKPRMGRRYRISWAP